MPTGIDASFEPSATRSPPPRGPDLDLDLRERWWTVLVRGVVAITFGIVALVSPRTSLLILTVVFGLYAIVDGFVHLLGAGRWTGEGKGWAVAQAILSLVAGIVALTWPGLTAVWLVLVIAAWAGLVGIAQVALSFQLRGRLHGEWLLATSGMLSIALAVALFVAPSVGVTIMLWLIGCYALVFGLLLVAVGLRLRVGPVPAPA